MKPIYWIILTVIVLGLGGYVASDYIGSTAPPDKLIEQALASDQKDALDAVVRLAAIRDKNVASPGLQQVAKETKDPVILAAALNGMRRFMDQDTFPLYFKALESPERIVRKAAYDNLLSFYGGRLPDGLTYDVDEDEASEERTQVIKRLRELATDKGKTIGK